MQRTKRIRIEDLGDGRYLFTYRAERRGSKRFVKIVFDSAKGTAKTIDADGIPHKVTWHLEKGVVAYGRSRLG